METTMVRPKSSETMQRVLDDLSDGRAVDWGRALQSASSQEERSWLSNLRLVDQVSGMARAADPTSMVLEGAADADGTQSIQPEQRPSDSTLRRAHAEHGTWGRLQLLEIVGQGAFGNVYRAWDPVLSRQVALKLMNTKALAMEGGKERVLEEARMLARVEHPNVARIYGVDEEGEQLGIWMEFVQGTDLSNVALERGRMDAEEVARIGVQLCEALHAVHAANVIHKDVKPQNVMRLTDGRILLMDFGAGSRRRIREGELEHVVTGTPRYMAPEIFLREKATPQSDIYSLGVTLYTLVTGEFPVEGTLPEIMQGHRRGERTLLRDREDQLPSAFVDVVDRAIASDRTQRFASAEEMGRALQDFLDHVHRERIVASTAPWRRWTRRVPRRAWLAAAAVAALVVVGGVLSQTLLAPPPPLEAEVQITAQRGGLSTPLASGDLITPRDRVDLSIHLNRDAYVYVLNRDSEGEATVLFPMAGDPRGNHLEGGREHAIPGEIGGERRYWGIGREGSMETFLVLASVEPLEQFESALTEVASIDLGDYMQVRPAEPQLLASLSQDAFSGDELTRGVTGLVGSGVDEETDIFALAELVADGGHSDGSVYLYHVSLRK